MKKTISFFLFISLLLFIIEASETNNNTLNETKTKTENEDSNEKENLENNNNEDSNENENNENTKEEEEEDKKEEEETGFYISERIFDEKLKKIMEEKHLKPKKKITKQQLRTIFGIIYKKEKKEGEERSVDPETGVTPEEHDKQYMDSIFNECTKSLDYDDKIRVREIKDWIHPIRVQEAYAELLQGLAETMGYL